MKSSHPEATNSSTTVSKIFTTLDRTAADEDHPDLFFFGILGSPRDPIRLKKNLSAGLVIAGACLSTG